MSQDHQLRNEVPLPHLQPFMIAPMAYLSPFGAGVYKFVPMPVVNFVNPMQSMLPVFPLHPGFLPKVDQPVEEPPKQEPEPSRAAPKEYKCDNCDKTFNRPSALKLHTLSHFGIKIFTCNVCNKSFSYKCNLKTHMRIHSGEKPYQCNICLRRFTAQGQLTDHLRIHSDYRPFKCDDCDKRFRRHSSLNMHIRVHSGEKPFKCETCDRAFASSGNLKVHMRVHVIFYLDWRTAIHLSS